MRTITRGLSRLALISICLGAIALSGCKSEPPQVKSKPLMVNTITATPSTETLWIETLGQTEGFSQIEVRPQVSGILKQISYREGYPVKTGDTLFVIDDEPYRAALNAASAATAQAKAQLEQAKREAARYDELFRNNAASRKLRDDSRTAAETAAAQLRSAKAKEADARINLERTRVKAPCSGIVSRSLFNQGALISTASSLLTTITQPDSLRVIFQVSERDLANKNVSVQSQVRLVDPAGTRIPGRIDFIAQQIDVATATRTMRALIPEAKGLVAGQLLTVQLQTDTLPNIFRVPQRAVLQKPDGIYQVFLCENKTVKAVPVKVGQWKETDWIILSGLKNGDEIIVNQLQRLRPGLQVTPTHIDRNQVR